MRWSDLRLNRPFIIGQRDIRNVLCLDASTGARLWRKPIDLTGCGGDALASAYHDGLVLFFASVGSHDAWRHRDGTLTWKRITTLDASDGEVVWSKPNNYRTRPLIVGDDLFIEPRVCDVDSGQIRTRFHPITGEQVPLEYLRPGHTCAITSASAHALFYRSYTAAFYDFTADNGLTIFGGIRPSCWINLVPASGLLLFPEGSAGCTCSFPVRCSVAYQHRPERPHPWNVFITHGVRETAQHFAINLGAPGDIRDDEGTVWFAYPNPDTRYAGNHYSGYGVKFDLHDQLVDASMGYYAFDVRSADIEGTDRPWLFASGCLGLTACEIPLIDDAWDADQGVYTVRLGFVAPAGDRAGQRVFDVRLQGDVVLEAFDIAKQAGATNRAIVKEFHGIEVSRELRIELTPQSAEPRLAQAPLINFIEVVREGSSPAQAIAAFQELSESEAREMLADADAALSRGNTSESLAAYHAVLDGCDSVDLQARALMGVASIGSPDSLNRLARYCKVLAPILWDYRTPPVELREAATAAYLAIADRTAEHDPERAVRMFQTAMEFATDELRPRAVAGLQRLGVEATE